MVKVEAEGQCGQSEYYKDSVIEREYAQDSSRIELAEESRVGERIVENPCNEKP